MDANGGEEEDGPPPLPGPADQQGAGAGAGDAEQGGERRQMQGGGRLFRRRRERAEAQGGSINTEPSADKGGEIQQQEQEANIGTIQDDDDDEEDEDSGAELNQYNDLGANPFGGGGDHQNDESQEEDDDPSIAIVATSRRRLLPLAAGRGRGLGLADERASEPSSPPSSSASASSSVSPSSGRRGRGALPPVSVSPPSSTAAASASASASGEHGQAPSSSSSPARSSASTRSIRFNNTTGATSSTRGGAPSSTAAATTSSYSAAGVSGSARSAGTSSGGASGSVYSTKEDMAALLRRASLKKNQPRSNSAGRAAGGAVERRSGRPSGGGVKNGNDDDDYEDEENEEEECGDYQGGGDDMAVQRMAGKKGKEEKDSPGRQPQQGQQRQQAKVQQHGDVRAATNTAAATSSDGPFMQGGPSHYPQQQRQEQKQPQQQHQQSHQPPPPPPPPPPSFPTPLNGLPDVQDRKRILGCLAGILAGMYSYDVADVDDVVADNNNTNMLMRQRTRSTDSLPDQQLQMQMQEQEQERLRQEYEVQQQQQQQQRQQAQEGQQAQQQQEEEEGNTRKKKRLERYESRPIYSDQIDDSDPQLPQETETDGEDETEGENDDDEFFDDSYYGDDVLLASPSAAAANRAADRADVEGGANRGKRGGGGGSAAVAAAAEMRRAESAPALHPDNRINAVAAAAPRSGPPGVPDQALSLPPQRQPQVQQGQQRPPVRQSLQLGAAPSRLFPRRHRRHTTALAIRRHRLRRYEVMSELLLSSAECLGLEERDVRGFLAMLEGMKTGGDGSARTKASKGKGGGAKGGRQRKGASAAASSSSVTAQSSSIGDGRMSMEAEAARGTGLMPIAVGGAAEEEMTSVVAGVQLVRQGSGSLPYESGTVDASGWSNGHGRRPQEQQEDINDAVPASPAPFDETFEDDWTNPALISPFLVELTPGAGFQCVSLLLLQHLLRSKSGYDARTRQVYKRLSLLVLMWEEKRLYDNSEDNEDGESDTSSTVDSEAIEIRACSSGEVIGIQHSPTSAKSNPSVSKSVTNEKRNRPTDSELAARAIRKFEAIERTVASKLIKLSTQQSSRRRKQKAEAEAGVSPHEIPREQPAQEQQRQQQSTHTQQPQPHGQTAHEQQQHADPQQRQGRPQNNRQQRRQQSASSASASSAGAVATRTGPRITRTQIMRGLKITSAGLAAGTLFAVTGGLAAPGIAAGIAAMTASTTITAAGAAVISTLTSSAAVCTIFGVGGGGLAAYKVSRRTQGVTEFEFRREDNGRARMRAEAAAARARKAAAGSNLRRRLQSRAEHDAVAQAAARAAAAAEAELYSTVCLSGWFRDVRDFQRAWGVNPTNPPITDRLELLERFYAVYQPSKIHRCGRILAHWRGEERQLWRLLRQKYGRDPDHTFPFDHGSRFDAELTEQEDDAVNSLLIDLGYDIPEAKRRSSSAEDDNDEDEERPKAAMAIGRIGQRITDKILHHNYEGHGAEDLSRMENQPPSVHALTNTNMDAKIAAQRQQGQQQMMPNATAFPEGSAPQVASSAAMASSQRQAPMPSTATPAASVAKRNDGTAPAEAAGNSTSGDDNKMQSLPRHLDTVWDYTAEYGGELYTVRWESDLLMELCDSVTDMVVDVLGAGTRELLKQTALATLVTAIAIPYAMIRAADSIDSCWTLAVERADEAGVELAKSLLESQAGHRPVTLLGYSMGARAIYSCLKELARHQEKWEDQRDKREAEEAMGAEQVPPTSASKSTSKKEGEEQVYSREPASIVEDVILMGTPNHVSIPSWEAARRVVSGRLVNCYSTKDLILSVLFQYKRMTGVLRPVCGCAPVRVPGVENYDITYLLNSHADYCMVVGEILRLVRHGQPRPTRGTGFGGETAHPDEAEEDGGDERESTNLDEKSQSTTNDERSNNVPEPLITPLGDEKVR